MTTTTTTTTTTTIPDYQTMNEPTSGGFSTSIGDLFAQPENERVDCCALFLCGMLQSDRDRFLTQGIPPPGVCRRFWLHLVLPCLLFFVATYEASHISQPVLNQIASWVCLLLFVTYLISQCMKGRHKRIEVRKDVLWMKEQLQQGQRMGVILQQERMEDRETDDHYACAHCGCYPQDYSTSTTTTTRDDNVCSQLYYCACAPSCGTFIQLCGICAIAQEARELEHILPPAYRRIDYLTMQSYSGYYPQIYRAQQQQSTSTLPALSRLSMRLLQAVLVFFGLMLLWSFVNSTFWRKVLGRNIPHHHFHYSDFIVFCFVWMQAVGLTLLVRYMVNHDMDCKLSADAMIKFFGAGFFLATITAVFWELVVGLTIKTIVRLALAIAGVDTVDDPSTAMLFRSAFGRAEASSFLDAYGQDHPVFYALYIAFQAFIVAAFVEELSKYFAYRMVEHPDFLSKEEIEEAMTVIYGQDEEELEQGRRERSSRLDFSRQRDSLQAHGAAITLAMICVAMGFTLCENLVYVFIYSGDSPLMEFYVLIARSLFPIHPIVAAIQSIGVVKRDVEGERGWKLGRIILPALLFHGGYDYFLLLLDFLNKRHGNFVAGDDDSIMDGFTVATSTASWIISGSFLFGALYYLYSNSRSQRERLKQMDERRYSVL